MVKHSGVLILGCAAALLACDKLRPLEPFGGLDAARPRIDATLPPPPPPADASPLDGTMPEPMSTVMPACGPRPRADLPFSKGALLESMGQCARFHACTFQAYQRDLTAKVVAYRQTPGEAERLAAQTAWRYANASAQRAELFRFGPAAPSGDPGGQDLRFYILSYPDFSRCLVDEQTVSKVYETTAFSSSRVAGKTLPALEYLLFSDDPNNGCPATNSINTEGSFRALAADELASRRRAYAEAAALDLGLRTDQLVNAWDPAQGNFLARLSSAGPGNETYPTQQAALNAVAGALFYLDKEIKDNKLEMPLGRNGMCMDACLGQFESLFAGVSTLNIRQNLAGVRELFQGCGDAYGGLGIDDWLIAENAGGAAERMLAALALAERLASEIDRPLDQAVVSDRARVEALADALREMARILRSEIVTVLDLELPMYAEGDND